MNERTPVIFKCEDEEIKKAIERSPLLWHYGTTGEVHVGDTLIIEGLDVELTITKRQWSTSPQGTELRIFIQR
ncbi:hypothetical protein QRD40_10795 [Comamonas sp. Y6]|uniref:Uncharacterized protein n=1 Tax=Comamonas resistens TaxID=3046670 RepID=A0ABY8SZ31_9BURK|nr:hypothetical protein [Comamonas resistens]MDL5036834.1 hypothetical protein [Comamonas resistens]WHS67144.1 hypothetical protein QMY55_08510 [Comamonas resistens]